MIRSFHRESKIRFSLEDEINKIIILKWVTFKKRIVKKIKREVTTN